jgi:hypothetical protein
MMKKHLFYFAAVIIFISGVQDIMAQANFALGDSALYANTTGTFNTAVGYRALRSNTSGSSNAAFGFQALLFNTTGNSNAAFGTFTLSQNTTGSFNTAIGRGPLVNNTTGSNNTASGYRALFANTTGSNNTASGSAALYFNTTGIFNTATGDSALYSNTTGNFNTANGSGALFSNTTGSNNVANGPLSLRANTTGNYSTASGYFALLNATTGSGNTASGTSALLATTTGSLNTALGYGAGASFNPSTSTFIGVGSVASTDVTNSTALGFGAVVTASNQVRLGNAAVTSIGGEVNWTAFSDGRFKKNLREDVPGLAFITKLRPVTYTLDVNGIDGKLKAKQPQFQGEAAKAMPAVQPSAEEQKAKAEKAKVVYTGFVAQEVEKVAQELNYDFSGVDKAKSKEDFYGLRYAEFVVPLVKAVQELDAANKQLRKDVEELKETVAKLINDKAVTANGANNTLVDVSGAYLYPNTPNPFSGTTVIRYYLPQGVASAQLIINNMKGQLLKTIMLNRQGDGQITLNADTLPAGSYTYALWANGRQADVKQMLLR